MTHHRDFLLAYARKNLTRDSDLAQDLVQEALIKAVKTTRPYDGRSTARSWLIPILRRTYIDHLRAEVRRVKLIGFEDLREDFDVGAREEGYALALVMCLIDGLRPSEKDAVLKRIAGEDVTKTEFSRVRRSGLREMVA